MRARFAVRDVCELEVASGLQRPPYLAEHLPLVGTQIDGAVGDDHVGPAIFYGQLLEDAASAAWADFRLSSIFG